MTTVHSAPRTVVTIGADVGSDRSDKPENSDSSRGERWARRQRRRRLLREQLLALAVLVLALAATLAVLATQWLASGPNANATGAGATVGAHTILGGPL